jgi:YqaJ-like viral recombinase domain
MKYKVNLYLCGLVISPYSPWIAASPDRKVYCPARNPPYGLLEIKCPQNDNICDIKYLDNKLASGRQLKRSHEYYYQVMCQLAVTGLQWCDFFVFLVNGEYHLETIAFDQQFWAEAQRKVDHFFFDHFVAFCP